MIVLSYGYKLPQDGDLGSTFFDDLEYDITRLNAHSHNGTDSAKLTASSVTGVTASISSASWVAVGGGTYRQAVSMPGGMSFDDYAITFRDASGHQLYLSVEKINASSYYVYINDNSKTLTAVYTA